MAEAKKFNFKDLVQKVKDFFKNIINKIKAVNWKELCSKVVKPVVAYSIVGGVAVVCLVIGILCAVL